MSVPPHVGPRDQPTAFRRVRAYVTRALLYAVAYLGVMVAWSAIAGEPLYTRVSVKPAVILGSAFALCPPYFGRRTSRRRAADAS